MKIKFLSLLSVLLLTSCQKEKRCKNLLLNNSDKVRMVSDNQFILENLDGYYEEVTLSFQTDSSYVIICWGDRKSFWWDFIRDEKIVVSIPYNRYKGKNVELDVKIIDTFKK